MQHTRRPAAVSWALVSVALACLFTDVAEAVFWFRVESHKSTCFTEEVGVEAATIHVRYHVQPNQGERHTNSEHLGSMSEANSIRPFTVTILKTDSQEVVLSKRVGDLKGSILATIDDTAQHVDVCFRADAAPKAGEKPLQLRTEIDHRQKALKRSKIPVRETVKNALPGGLAIETFVDSGGQVEEVLKTQQELAHMYRSLEDVKAIMEDVKATAKDFTISQRRFLQTSESTYDRVWMTSFITVSIVVLTSYYQYHHLKGYLLKKKFV